MDCKMFCVLNSEKINQVQRVPKKFGSCTRDGDGDPTHHIVKIKSPCLGFNQHAHNNRSKEFRLSREAMMIYIKSREPFGGNISLFSPIIRRGQHYLIFSRHKYL